MTEEELDDLLLCEHTNGALQAYNYLSRKMSIERNQMLNKNPYEPDPEMHPHECEPDPELQFDCNCGSHDSYCRLCGRYMECEICKEA